MVAKVDTQVGKPYGSASINIVYLGVSGGSSAFLSEEIFLVGVVRGIGFLFNNRLDGFKLLLNF